MRFVKIFIELALAIALMESLATSHSPLGSLISALPIDYKATVLVIKFCIFSYVLAMFLDIKAYIKTPLKQRLQALISPALFTIALSFILKYGDDYIDDDWRSAFLAIGLAFSCWLAHKRLKEVQQAS